MSTQNWSRNPIIAVMEMVDLVADLLFKHNCVIVPGLGGFVSNYSKAEFKEEYQTILPARKRIAFNEKLHENDGLLINHVAKTKGISYSEAEVEVNKFVEYASERIHHHKSFEFKNVGTFYYTRENNVVFVPYEGINMLTDSYGLSPLKLRATQKMSETADVRATVEVVPDTKKVKKIKQNRKSNFNIKRLWPVISGAAVILFVAISIQFLSQLDLNWELGKKKEPNKQQDASLLHFDSQSTTIHTPVQEVAPVKQEADIPVKPVAPVAVEAPTAPEPKEIKETAPVVDASSTEKNPDWLAQWQKNRNPVQYYIVIEQSAQETTLASKVDALNQSGYTARVVEQDQQYYLSIEQFSADKNATEYLRLIQRSFKKAKIIPIAS
jgi:nucleoid DNA-binding protein